MRTSSIRMAHVVFRNTMLAWVLALSAATGHAAFDCSSVDFTGSGDVRALYFLAACGAEPTRFQTIVEEGRGEMVTLEWELTQDLDDATPFMHRVEYLYVRGGGSAHQTAVILFTDGVDHVAFASNARWTRQRAAATAHYWNVLPYEFIRRAAVKMREIILMEGTNLEFGVNSPLGFIEIGEARGALAWPYGYTLITEAMVDEVADALALDADLRPTKDGSVAGPATVAHELTHFNHYYDEGWTPFAYVGEFGALSRKNGTILGVPVPFWYEDLAETTDASFVSVYARSGEWPILEDYADTLCTALGVTQSVRAIKEWTEKYPPEALYPAGSVDPVLAAKATYMRLKYTYDPTAEQDADNDGLGWSPKTGLGDCDDSNPTAASCEVCGACPGRQLYTFGYTAYVDNLGYNPGGAFPMEELPEVRDAAAGYRHALALAADGSVWAWGENWMGQLGVGVANEELVEIPIKVQGLADVVAVASGERHSAALKSDGTVWTWGDGNQGQLGTGAEPYTGAQSSVPVQVMSGDGVSPLTSVVEVEAGTDFTAARTAEGKVLAWGYGYEGVFGDGNLYQNSGLPRQAVLENVVDIAAGYQLLAAVDNTGKVYTWGSNADGALGSGTSEPNQSLPVALEGVANVVEVAIGRGSLSNHVLALRSDGTVWSWGANDYGQLGDGSTEGRSTPVQVQNLSGIVGVAAGFHHSLAVKSDGTVWGWGSDTDYQLGVISGGTHLTPTQVQRLDPETWQMAPLNGMTEVRAGEDASFAW